MKDNAVLTLTGNITNSSGQVPQIDLEPGWNLIGTHMPLDIPVGDIFSKNMLNYSSIWEFSGNTYTKITQEVYELKPTKSYWVYLQNPSAQYSKNQSIIDFIKRLSLDLLEKINSPKQ
jgi:hypothetical protein